MMTTVKSNFLLHAWCIYYIMLPRQFCKWWDAQVETSFIKSNFFFFFFYLENRNFVCLGIMLTGANSQFELLLTWRKQWICHFFHVILLFQVLWVELFFHEFVIISLKSLETKIWYLFTYWSSCWSTWLEKYYSYWAAMFIIQLVILKIRENYKNNYCCQSYLIIYTIKTYFDRIWNIFHILVKYEKYPLKTNILM